MGGMTIMMAEPTFCRFCRSKGIQTVNIVEPHGHKIKTMLCCPICGEVLRVVWSKKRRIDE
jgi:hypothetical protein